MSVTHPPVLWAQRKDVLYVTIDVQDCTAPKVKLDDTEGSESKTLKFSGVLTDSSTVEVQLELHKDVDSSKTKVSATGRHVVLVIPKIKEEFWPRLTKDKPPRFVSIDWSKWVDEDDEDDDDRPAFDMGQYGDLGDFDDDDDEDEDDE